MDIEIFAYGLAILDVLLGSGLLYQIYAAGKARGENEARMKALEEQGAEAEAALEKVHSELKRKIDATHGEHGENIVGAHKRIDSFSHEVAETKQAHATLKAGIEQQLHGVDQLSREVRELLKSSVAGETDADHMKDRIKTLESEIKTLLSASSAIEARLHRLITIEAEIAALRSKRG